MEGGDFLGDVEAVKRLVVSVHDGRPVYLADLADIRDGAEEAEQYLFSAWVLQRIRRESVVSHGEITLRSPFPWLNGKGPMPPGWQRIC